MNYKLEKKDGCVLTYTVDIDRDDLSKAEDLAIKEIQKEVSWPGFRKGNVPYDIIRKHFVDELKQRTLNIAALKIVDTISEREGIIPVVVPYITDIKRDANNIPVGFKVRFEVSPQFDVKGYTDFEVVKKIKKITDEDVEKHINQIKEYYAYLKPVDEPVSKDKYVLIDYEVFEGDKKIDEVRNEIIDMSSPQMIAGFEDAVIGAKKGDTKEFETEYNNRKIRFVVNIKDVKVKIVPEIDESILTQLGVKNIDELRTQVKQSLENEEIMKAEKSVIEQIENRLIENNPFPLPPSLVRREMEELFEIVKKRANISPEQKVEIKDYEDKLKPIAERNLRIAYILHAIAKKENIQSTDEDYLKELDRVISELKSEEEIKKAKELFHARKGYIMASITENKTMDFIKSRIKIKEITE